MREPRGRCLLALGNNLIHAIRYRTQVCPIHRAVNINDRNHVVMADGAGLDPAMNAGNVGKNLQWRAAGACNGNILQILQRIHAVLRSLHRDLVTDAALPVQPELWRGLEAAAQRSQHAIRHVRLTQTDLLRLRPVHIHRQVRRVERLLDVKIDSTRNSAQLRHHRFRQGMIAVDIRTDNLDIQWRRQAEVQNLIHDVGRQKIKSDARKVARQFLRAMRECIPLWDDVSFPVSPCVRVP